MIRPSELEAGFSKVTQITEVLYLVNLECLTKFVEKQQIKHFINSEFEKKLKDQAFKFPRSTQLRQKKQTVASSRKWFSKKKNEHPTHPHTLSKVQIFKFMFIQRCNLSFFFIFSFYINEIVCQVEKYNFLDENIQRYPLWSL